MLLLAEGHTGEVWEHSKTLYFLRSGGVWVVAILSLFKVVFNGVTNYTETTKTDEW